MRELKPYKTLQGLQKAIDNGGRFYNFLTSAGDDVVTRAELAKAAGVFSAGHNAFLFLEMAQQDLPADHRDRVSKMLEPSLRNDYRKKRPMTLTASEVEEHGKAGKTVIVSGYPRFVEDRTEFGGFIMIPINAGSVTTFTMVPIFDQYDLYELSEGAGKNQPSCMIATNRGKQLDHDGPIRFGGVLKKLEYKDEAKQTHQYYLDSVYYTKCEPDA